MTATASLGEGLAFAVRFLPRAWKGAWLSLLLGVAVVAAVAGGLVAMPAGSRALVILVWVVAAQSALYPLALATAPSARERAGHAARLAVVSALILLLLAVVAMIALVVLLGAAFGVASAGAGFKADNPATWQSAVDGRGRQVLGAVAALCAAGMAWVLIRVGFSAPATVAGGRVRVLSGWPLTRGFVLRSLAGRVAVNAVPVAILWALAWGTGKGAPAPLAGLAAGVVVAAFMLPLNVGLMTYLYRQTVPAGDP